MNSSAQENNRGTEEEAGGSACDDGGEVEGTAGLKKVTNLPSGWTVGRLDEVTVRGSGHTPNQKYPDYWNGGIPWVSLADLSQLDKPVISETAKEISREGLRRSSAVLHPRGTVMMSRDAGVGKS